MFLFALTAGSDGSSDFTALLENTTGLLASLHQRDQCEISAMVSIQTRLFVVLDGNSVIYLWYALTLSFEEALRKGTLL
eukprot:Em0003g943a